MDIYTAPFSSARAKIGDNFSNQIKIILKNISGCNSVEETTIVEDIEEKKDYKLIWIDGHIDYVQSKCIEDRGIVSHTVTLPTSNFITLKKLYAKKNNFNIFHCYHKNGALIRWCYLSLSSLIHCEKNNTMEKRKNRTTGTDFSYVNYYNIGIKRMLGCSDSITKMFENEKKKNELRRRQMAQVINN